MKATLTVVAALAARRVGPVRSLRLLDTVYEDPRYQSSPRRLPVQLSAATRCCVFVAGTSRPSSEVQLLRRPPGTRHRNARRIKDYGPSRSTWASYSSPSVWRCPCSLFARRNRTSPWSHGLRTDRDYARPSDGLFWHTTIGDRESFQHQPGGPRQQPERRHGLGAFPLFFTAASMSLERTAALAAIYPATWGFVQLGTVRSRTAWPQMAHRRRNVDAGRRHRDHRTVRHFVWFAVGAVLLGVGTAMVYPTLLAGIGDVADPPGGRQPSASIASGETSAMPSVRSSLASPRISSA